MILVAGIADESPVALVIDALEAIGVDYRVFDQRRAAGATLTIDVADAAGGGAIGGTLVFDGETIALEDIRGLYLRLMDDQLLPEIAALPPDSPVRRNCRHLHELLLEFADLAPARVLNRPSDMASNQSKPFQAQAIRRAGFDIPETLITNDPWEARAFVECAWADAGAVIYKSISGVRSIVQKIEMADLARLDRIRWCPTMFQRWIPGTDIRVHVVGHAVAAVEIGSTATDYRYATRQTGVEAAMLPVELEPAVRSTCIDLAWRLNLPLAGIDLRRTPEGRYVCFEVNPSPAFSYYENASGISVASCIARYLAREIE